MRSARVLGVGGLLFCGVFQRFVRFPHRRQKLLKGRHSSLRYQAFDRLLHCQLLFWAGLIVVFVRHDLESYHGPAETNDLTLRIWRDGNSYVRVRLFDVNLHCFDVAKLGPLKHFQQVTAHLQTTH